AHLRARERVRRHLHVPGPAPTVTGRGGPLPVPAGRLLGAFLQRVPGERRPAVPGRRLPPPVRAPVRPPPTRAAEGRWKPRSPPAEARLHEEGIAGKIFLFKNNTDSAGNSYG